MKIKKIIAAVTALVLIGGAYNATAAKNIISSAFAADTEASAEVVKDGIKYTISNGEATVKELVDKTIIDLIIPDEVDGCPVTEIGSYSINPEYDEVSHIRSLVLGKNVKKIGWDAFSDCYELETVTLNDALEEIDNYAFSSCYNLKEVKTGSKLKYIGIDAFRMCLSLESFVIGENVNEIEEGAFYRSGIEVFEVPERFTSIKNVFYTNNTLHKYGGIIKIKNPECKIYGSGPDWENVLIVCDKNSYASRQAELYGLKWCTFEQYEKGEYEKTELSPLDSQISLRDYGMIFEETEGGLKVDGIAYVKDNTLVVPDEVGGVPVVEFDSLRAEDGVRKINSGVANDIKKIVLGKNVKRLGDYAFDEFKNLEYIEGGENVEAIGDNAFENTNLKTIVIPESVKDIGANSFTWKDKTSEDKVVVKFYSADCALNSNSIDLDMVDKIYGYAGSTVAKLADLWRMDNFYAFGDANCDDGVDMGDVVLVMQSLANPNKYGLNGTDEHHITEKGIDCADVEGNGNGITASDALKIQKYLLGQEKFS